MPMNKAEAFEIIELVSNVYDMKFNETKFDIWLEFLTRDGDYQPTLKEAKKYIKDGNTYPPKIPNIMRKAPKKLEYEELPDATKEHRYKMANDPEYRAKRQRAIDEFKRTISKFGVNSDE